MYDEEVIEYFEKQQEESVIFINSSELIKINYDDINVGNKLVINYYPDSQRYIYDLYTKFGTVTEINLTENDLSFIKLENANNKYTASHEHVGMYSRGYDYTIFKLKAHSEN